MSRAPKPAAVAVAEPPIARVTEEVPTASLLVNPRNPNKHGEAQIAGLMASLRTDGQTRSIVARRENRMLIAGHGVHEAATRLGLEYLTVVLLDVDQARADRIMLGDNRHSALSTTDEARVNELLREIDEAEWLAAGYSDEAVGKLFAKVEASDLQVHEIEFSDRKDTFWIAVRGPLQDQALALRRLRDLMREMPKVEVTLGTTDDLS